jgi:MFS family permease
MNEDSDTGSVPRKDNSSSNPDREPAVYVGNIGPFTPLKIRNFRYLLTGTVLTNAGQFIQQVTLSWLVYDMTGSGAMLGYINLVRSVAALGMIPAAGILIDRLDRRKLMLMDNAWLLIITLVLGLLLVFGRAHLYYLFIFTFLGGMAQTVDITLRQVIVFNLVPRALTPNALALIQTGWGLMRSLGPAIGGFLILWFGPGGNFLVQAGAYGLIMFNILQIQFRMFKVDTVRRSPFQNIREGMHYIARERMTRTFMMVGFILPLFIVPVFTVLTPKYGVYRCGRHFRRHLYRFFEPRRAERHSAAFSALSAGRVAGRFCISYCSLERFSTAGGDRVF